MKRDEYLSQLRLTLQGNEFGPVEEAIAYFEEILDDRIQESGLDEEAAVAGMENPAQVALQLAHAHSRDEGTLDKKPAPSAPSENQEPGLRTITLQASQVRSILVRDRNTRIILRGWDKEDIVIHHPETQRIQYEFSLAEGQLSLVRKPMEFSLQWFQFESLSREMREVTLDVPHELAADLDLRTSNARINAGAVNCWGKASLVSSNASLHLNDFSARSIHLKSSNGSLNLQQVHALKELVGSSSNGSIKAEEVKAPDRLALTTSNANIQVKALESAAISLASSNANIRGSLAGKLAEYSISSTTSNGRNNLPRQQQGGSKTLEVRTSNGKIELEFEAD